MTARAAICVLALALAVAAGTVPARAFHELDCGPLRPTLTDPDTGESACGTVSLEAQRQYLRARRLEQEQERRTRDLLLRQKRRAKSQNLIAKQESARQRQFTLRNTVRQKQPAIENEQSIVLQEVLNAQAFEAARREQVFRISDLDRQRILLEQEIELMKSGLLDEQNLRNRLLRKEQDAR